MSRVGYDSDVTFQHLGLRADLHIVDSSGPNSSVPSDGMRGFVTYGIFVGMIEDAWENYIASCFLPPSPCPLSSRLDHSDEARPPSYPTPNSRQGLFEFSGSPPTIPSAPKIVPVKERVFQLEGAVGDWFIIHHSRLTLYPKR
jgi:hypothetical protein